MIKASLFALASSLGLARVNLITAACLLALLPVLEASYMAVHHGNTLDGFWQALLVFYNIELVGYFGANLFILEGQARWRRD